MTEGPWLVTGASGFLGRHLLQEIQAAAPMRRTIALVRDPDEWARMEWTGSLERVTPLAGSVTETKAWAADPRLDGLAGIFHLAALVRHGREDAEQVHRTNVEGTLNMVRLGAARRCRVIFVSTSGTVGCFRRPGMFPDEEAPFCEREISGWPYYRSKLVAERESRRLADELDVELVIVRPPVLLGPGDQRYRSTNHVARFLRGKLPFVIRGGMHFADVRDVARALLRAMQRPEVRPVYHLPGTVCSIEEFYAMAAKAAGRPAPRLMLPFRAAWWLAKLGHPFHLVPEPTLVEMASRHWSMQSRYAAADLDYRSRPGPETMADTVTWLVANHPELAPSRRRS